LNKPKSVIKSANAAQRLEISFREFNVPSLIETINDRGFR